MGEMKIVNSLHWSKNIFFSFGNSMDAWLFNGSTFWTFDDQQTIMAKTNYIRKQNLGGVMFWELSGDGTNGTLIHTIHCGLNQNCP